jgi:hypothetical protein
LDKADSQARRSLPLARDLDAIAMKFAGADPDSADFPDLVEELKKCVSYEQRFAEGFKAECQTAKRACRAFNKQILSAGALVKSVASGQAQERFHILRAVRDADNWGNRITNRTFGLLAVLQFGDSAFVKRDPEKAWAAMKNGGVLTGAALGPKVVQYGAALVGAPKWLSGTAGGLIGGVFGAGFTYASWHANSEARQARTEAANDVKASESKYKETRGRKDLEQLHRDWDRYADSNSAAYLSGVDFVAGGLGTIALALRWARPAATAVAALSAVNHAGSWLLGDTGTRRLAYRFLKQPVYQEPLPPQRPVSDPPNRPLQPAPESSPMVEVQTGRSPRLETAIAGTPLGKRLAALYQPGKPEDSASARG